MNKLFSIVFILLFCSLSLSKEYSYNDYVGISYVKIDASEVFSIGFQNRFKNDYSAGIGFVYYNTDGVFADSKTRIWLPKVFWSAAGKPPLML